MYEVEFRIQNSVDRIRKSEKGEMKVAKAQSGKATKYLFACVPMELCAFQIKFDLDKFEKTKPISPEAKRL